MANLEGVKNLSELIFIVGNYVKDLENENIQLKKILDEFQRSKSEQWTSLRELPDVLLADDIAKYLHKSKQTIYTLFKIPPEHGGIPVIRDNGRARRCLKSDFIAWLQRNTSRNDGR